MPGPFLPEIRKKSGQDENFANEKSYLFDITDSNLFNDSDLFDSSTQDSLLNKDNHTPLSSNNIAISPSNESDNNTSCKVENIDNVDSEKKDNTISNANPLLQYTEKIEPNTDCTDLTVVSSNQLILAAQIITRTIRISIKSILISISLTILNLFI